MGISLDAPSRIISVTSPTTVVTIAELVTAIRNWEDELSSLTYPHVIDTDGKTDLKGGKYTAITLTISSMWQVQFWNGVTLGITQEGNLVGGVGDEPIKATGGMDTIIVNNEVGGVIIVSGSGVTDQDKTDIIDGVFDETMSGRVIDGTFGKTIIDIESDVTALFDESGGKWEITSNQMIIYKADNITELMRFNLFDAGGSPAMENVMKRERV